MPDNANESRDSESAVTGNGFVVTPASQCELRAFGILLAAVAIVTLVLAGAYGFLTGPAWRLIDPGRDHGRMILIRDTLDELAADPATPRFLALGDSVCMSAFDSAVFEENMGGGFSAYNLAQSGKAMPELLFETGHPAVKSSAVVLFISPLTTFTRGYIDVYPRKANFYRVLDYPYSPELWSGYHHAVPDANVDYVTRTKAFHAFELRWLVSNNLLTNAKNAVTARLKQALGKQAAGVALDCDYYSVKYPGWDSTAPEPDYQAHRDLLAAAKPYIFAGEFRPDEQQLASFSYVVDELSRSCREVVLVKAPVHPKLRAELGPQCLGEFNALLDGYAGGNILVIDLIESMPADAFRDALHIIPDYAGEVTQKLCAGLKGEAD